MNDAAPPMPPHRPGIKTQRQAAKALQPLTRRGEEQWRNGFSLLGLEFKAGGYLWGVSAIDLIDRIEGSRVLWLMEGTAVRLGRLNHPDPASADPAATPLPVPALPQGMGRAL